MWPWPCWVQVSVIERSNNQFPQDIQNRPPLLILSSFRFFFFFWCLIFKKGTNKLASCNDVVFLLLRVLQKQHTVPFQIFECLFHSIKQIAFIKVNQKGNWQTKRKAFSAMLWKYHKALDSIARLYSTTFLYVGSCM